MLAVLVLCAGAAPALDCRGSWQQGGYAVCRTDAGSTVSFNGDAIAPDDQGDFVIGFDRDAADMAEIIAATPSGLTSLRHPVSARSFSVQTITGLPPAQVSPDNPETLAKIARDIEKKTAGFASHAALRGFTQPFLWPVQGRVSASYGAQRVLNGEAKKPHYGVDIAAATGTPVIAPADGVVTLAETDMHFEGGLILIDHGQGLVTAYLHLSTLDVATGQNITQGTRIGTVGAKGRATGPHLCWRMTWRGQHLDPSLWVSERLGAAQKIAPQF
jgi:murein DD-endopeptidase MepM/ murein hydrolase activator NlpD